MSLPASEPVNPYASPQIDGGYSPRQQLGFDGLWRHGDVLVMHKQAPLPPICVKSGQPATEWLRRDLQWYPWWVVWTTFVALPVYIILVLVLSQKATVMIGLTREWGNRRRIRMLVTAGIVAAGIAIAVVGFFAASGDGDRYELAFVLIPIGLLAGLVGGTAFGQYACRLVWPKRISGQFIWLHGV
ncbi:MAG TPA: hypothetical protein VKH44_02680, partial [Pirellulaceae bacterium]|nr:hypothetical protein [Pirellulaceae bacterium]